tara:strand:+ start:44159 stop:44389 length:231 start_codon:yes stop_codon:yes gene_type:complete
MATWKEHFKETLEETGDKYEDLVCTLSDTQLNREFDDGYGGPEGTSFTAWSEEYVYFSRDYDGADYIDYALRNPIK